VSLAGARNKTVEFLACKRVAVVFAFVLFLVSWSGLLLTNTCAQASQVTLAWDASSDPDVAGYKLYYGTRSKSYSAVIPVGNRTTYSVPGLESGTGYYFAVTAYDNSGLESEFSNEASYTAPAGGANVAILWRNASSGDNNLWYLSESQIVKTESLPVASTGWEIISTNDFNSDGKADILWRNTASGDTVVWYLNNGTKIGSASLGTVPTAWSIAAVGDFNSDGKTDILWRNTSGAVAIWYLNNGTLIGSASLGTVPTAWSIAAVGDFNSDGKTDILWRNTSGALSVWYIGGTGSGGALPSVPDTNWKVAGVLAP
jgi:hypothetical protein